MSSVLNPNVRTYPTPNSSTYLDYFKHLYPALDLKQSTVYLSLDIGIRNFAYCVVAFPNTEPFPGPYIFQWEKLDLLLENGVCVKDSKKVPMSKLYPLVHKSLERRLELWQFADKIVVEQQIGHSRNAKLEGMVCMWIHIHLQKPMVHVSPRQKSNVKYGANGWVEQKTETGLSYQQRKQHTVEVTKNWLQSQPRWLQTFFQSHSHKTNPGSKQDDLADVLVQAIAVHIKSMVYIKATGQKRKRKK
jgi:hypothetical protein